MSNKEPSYIRCLEDMTKINNVIIQRKERAQALKRKKEKEEEHKEFLKYNSINKCLIRIMNDELLLKAMQTHGKTHPPQYFLDENRKMAKPLIKFAEEENTNEKYKGYDHLAIFSTHNCFDHIGLYSHSPSFKKRNINLNYNIIFGIAIKDYNNKIKYEHIYITEQGDVEYDYYTNKYYAASAILHRHDYLVRDNEFLRSPNANPNAKNHTAESIIASLENAVKKLYSSYLEENEKTQT